jgi:hypothetical protein
MGANPVAVWSFAALNLWQLNCAARSPRPYPAGSSGRLAVAPKTSGVSVGAGAAPVAYSFTPMTSIRVGAQTLRC